MEFVNDPVKSKRVFILMLILTIVFFLASAAFGYFYYKSSKNNKILQDAKKTLENDKLIRDNQLSVSSQELQKQVADLKTENDKLTSDNETLTNQANANKTKSDKVKAYTATLSFVNGIIEAHNGFDGWTEAEFQQGRSIAQGAGDPSFINTVDWAWNRTDISQITRFVGFLKAVVNGINANLWK